MVSNSGPRRSAGLMLLSAFLCTLAWCLSTPAVAVDGGMAPEEMLDQVSQGMVRRHPGITREKFDNDKLEITLKRGEGDKEQKLFLWANKDEEQLANEDFFEHFEYKGYEFTLRGNNNMAVVGGVDGLMDRLEEVTQYLKDNKIEPESLKKGSRISILFAGELVFRWQLATPADAPAVYYINGTLFHSGTATWLAKDVVEKECNAFNDASKALQDKIDADKDFSYGVKKALIHLVEIAHETDTAKLKKDKNDDQLTDTFCRLVINDGYFEKALGDKISHIKAELDGWRAAYKAVSVYQARFVLLADDKSELTEYQNAWGNKLWVYYVGKTSETHLIIRHHEPDTFKLYLHRIFAKADPKEFDKLLTRDDYDRVTLNFPFYGVLASYDLKAKIFDCDVPKWDNAAKAFFPSKMNPVFLPPAQMFPPHIPIYRYDGQIQGIVVPKGPIFPPDFRAISADRRQAAHDAFFRELADKLDTPGYLHLLFEALSQYVYDTPDPTYPAVIGNLTQKSDIHQTADQTLDSKLGGRFLGDCDDFAEFYNKVTQLQGKPSFVMGLPGHAACGYVTKLEDGKYQMNFLDTGPARELVRGELDRAVEDGVRSYDDQNQATFSPDQVEFLFRFAGESTRTPYVLSTRMFVDPKYAEAMIRVQSYWHFHTFNLGIQTMEKMLADGDKDSANYNEVASLYSWSRQWENCFKRHAECMAAIKKDDTLTSIEAVLRLAEYQHDAQMNTAAVETLTGLNKTLAEVQAQDLGRVAEFSVQTSQLWLQVKEPYHAFEPMSRVMMLRNGSLLPMLAGNLVEIFAGMSEYNTTHVQSNDQKIAYRQLGGLLNRIYSRNEFMFFNCEDVDDELRRYAALASFYRARMGEKDFRAKLLEKDETPPKGEKPSTHRVPGDVDSDFLYFRASFFVYFLEASKYLDDEDGTKTPDVKESLKWSALAIKAFARQQEFTESPTGDMVVKELQANVAMLTQDWPTLTKLYDEAKTNNYARHNLTLADSLGRLAKFVKIEDFKKACDLFDTHVGIKQYYYQVAYMALQAKAYDAAAYAADVAAKRYPQDPIMVNEAVALKKSIPVVKKWYEDRAIAIKKEADDAKAKAEAAKKQAEEDAKKKAEADAKKKADEDAANKKLEDDTKKKPENAPKPMPPVPAPVN